METTTVIARLIKHSRTIPNPLSLIKTFEDLLNFASVECVLQTDRAKDIEDHVFVILQCEGEESHYIVYLKKCADGSHIRIGHGALTDWDSQATLTQH